MTHALRVVQEERKKTNQVAIYPLLTQIMRGATRRVGLTFCVHILF